MQEIASPLPPEEIQEFYKETGIDLSGVIHEMIPCAQDCTRKYAMTFINYLKGLKEFMDLSLHDRIIIVRGELYLLSKKKSKIFSFVKKVKKKKKMGVRLLRLISHCY